MRAYRRALPGNRGRRRKGPPACVDRQDRRRALPALPLRPPRHPFPGFYRTTNPERARQGGAPEDVAECSRQVLGLPLDPVGPTTTCSRSLFSVRVPVLSTQATSTRPKDSTADSRRTSALREASRRATAASPRLERSGRPSGTAAMAVPAPSASWAARGRRQSRPPRMTSAPPPTTTGEHFQQHAVKAPLEHARVLGWAPKGGCSDTKARVAADRERHRRARPDGHVGAVEHYASLDRSPLGTLRHRKGLTRQGGLIDLEPARDEHARVRRYPLACGE
jgi:hypothetical protein